MIVESRAQKACFVWSGYETMNVTYTINLMVKTSMIAVEKLDSSIKVTV